MSNNPNPSKSEEAYTRYWEEHESDLLAEFLEAHPGFPAVKDWGAWEQERFDNYVQASFEAQGPDEDEGRERGL